MTTFSRVEYPDLTGAVSSFVIPFQYFETNDLEVSVNGSVVADSAYTITGSNIEFLAGFFPVGRLVIRRITDLTDPEVRFSASSPIRAQDLNAAIDQAFFAIQEVTDGFTGLGITFTPDGNFLLPLSAVGLTKVDNTSDADKPISTATQAALNLKLDASALDPASIYADVVTQSGGTDGIDARTLRGLSPAALQDWRNLTNKPSAFLPSAHTHSAADIQVGQFPDSVISASAVKQHEQALAIRYTQLTNVPPGSLGEVLDGKTYIRTQGAWVLFDPEENELLKALGISLSDILGD